MGKLPALPAVLTPTRISASTTTTSLSPVHFQVRTQIPHPALRRLYLHRPHDLPLPLYRAAKDTRNTLLWQPSEKSLRNVELDEAGKLAAFRERFGRGYDAAAQDEETGESVAVDDGFADLLAEFAPQDTSALKDSGPKKAANADNIGMYEFLENGEPDGIEMWD
ncbi:hypothetical protein PT974_04366 [Cladobotryum mycophilum]|uniref:Uncharacterized protein n=1 Tax=Cladobotryum mycophilum TaxID=491253 RepID=A0ABR0SV02_9HYPO